MATDAVYILGGHQTDFARNWTREGGDIYGMMKTCLEAGLAETGIEAKDLQTCHIGNFVAELFCGQGQLGGMFVAIDPAFSGLPTARHEAACASGSLAVLAAAAEIEAGRYDLACVLGVEFMRNVHGDQAAAHLGAARWVGREADDVGFVWPHLFSELAVEYHRRHGLEYDHLMEIARIAMENGRRNPNAQTRKWEFRNAAFTADDAENPVIEGWMRRRDCGQVTDGAAVVFLASPRFAEEFAKKSGRPVESLSKVAGWGHSTATMCIEDKFTESAGSDYVLPHVKGAIDDAYCRAGIGSATDLDVIETHDCFTITEYMAIDHFGITAPGESWKAIEDGTIGFGGRLPVNPSGGLIGLGHPVGASGVRMVLDAHKQVTGRAGDYQVAGARRAGTLNIGGSATTTASFVVERADG
ncbi:acetyl-CoA acetyltransferase [Ruegeria jejuensis]|uniref:acetyl-CoA acetyltransferase n=1 Tax=Ruegeria jejuensis TaxID=3233338 RepID=UPI00355BA634